MNKSDREKKKYIRELIIMGLGLAIVVLTISYATVHATLDIAGISATRVVDWSVGFESAEVVSKTGSAEIVVPPTINGQNIHYEVNLKHAGDSIKIKAVVRNNGHLEAKLKSFDIFGVPTKYEDNINYSVTLEDGEFLHKGIVLKKVGSAREKDKLTIYINLSYDKMIEEGEGTRSFDLALGLNFIQNCEECSE